MKDDTITKSEQAERVVNVRKLDELLVEGTGLLIGEIERALLEKGLGPESIRLPAPVFHVGWIQGWNNENGPFGGLPKSTEYEMDAFVLDIDEVTDQLEPRKIAAVYAAGKFWTIVEFFMQIGFRHYVSDTKIAEQKAQQQAAMEAAARVAAAAGEDGEDDDGEEFENLVGNMAFLKKPTEYGN